MAGIAVGVIIPAATHARQPLLEYGVRIGHSGMAANGEVTYTLQAIVSGDFGVGGPTDHSRLIGQLTCYPGKGQPTFEFADELRLTEQQASDITAETGEVCTPNGALSGDTAYVISRSLLEANALPAV